MKKILLAILIFYFLISCQKNSEKNKDLITGEKFVETDSRGDVYDAVVVGGGLSGLSAAYNLQKELGENAKILLLEKENRLGGKILTKKFNNDIYELGASFDYGKAYAPKGFEPSELVKLSKNYGVYLDGTLYSAGNIPELLRKIDPKNARFFSEFDKNQNINKLFDSVSDDVKKAIESSFKVIHFGEFKDYIDERKKDAFKTYNLDFHVKGNYEFLDFYTKILKGNYLLGAEVESIEQKGNEILVQYKKGSKTNVLKARSVIVATPATVTQKIVKNMKEESENFVKSVRYTKTFVVVFITNRNKPIDFSYILTPDKVFNFFTTSFSVDKKRNIFSIYFTDAFINLHQDWKNDDYIKAAYKDFQSMQLVDLDMDLLHIDSCFWEEEGPVISEKTYKNFSETALNPITGVFLAGDYTFWNEYKIPYGIPPAYFSGRKASKKVVEYLKR